MYTKPPSHIESAWRLYHSLEDLFTHLWTYYEADFLEYYFPEICGMPEPPDDEPEAFDGEDDIPF